MSPRRLSFPACLLLSCLWTSSCGSAGVSRASDFSSLSSPPGVPEAVAVDSDKTVRPDMLVVRFSLRQETDSSEKALPVLKAAVDRYVRAAAEATKSEVVPRLSGFGVEAAGYGRKMSSDSSARGQVVVHGALEVALPATLDFWGRSALVAKLLELARTTATEAEKQELVASFADPAPALRDPESHRAELLELWVKRTRAFTATAQVESAPLAPVECTPPGAVQQRAVSLEEVALTLPVSCRLAVVPASAGGRPVAAAGK
ncbi:hypothetical protein JRI60_41855 [Archangium violaceum]|uniref:hypothetical protein n=1 Tax=Archangium violaceum TaxID=83451 RepID=UPI00195244A2|nr:hypothetical protein [Archangium violaceum]QRN95542.1 hypothetical protein JRI60_41855 [Archangium violaceum]